MVRKAKRYTARLFKAPLFYYRTLDLDCTKYTFTPAKKYRTRNTKPKIVKDRLLKLHQVPKPYFLPKTNLKVIRFADLKFKTTSRTRPQSIKIRVSDSELYHLRIMAKHRGLTVATLMRETTLSSNTSAIKRIPPKLDKIFMRAFAGACNNINQLVHQLHIDKNASTPLDFMTLAIEIQEVNYQLQTVIDYVEQGILNAS